MAKKIQLRRIDKWIGILLILVIATVDVYAQEIMVQGQVVSASDGEPLPGATVLLQGTQRGTTTDAEGNYEIDVPEDGTLVFSFTGYVSQEITVAGRTTIDVELSSSIEELDDVVVTAFGVERDKKALGYSVTEVSGDEFTEAREVNFGDALQGKVAGVNVSNIGSGVGGSSRVIIRGNASLSGNNEPLYVIDGVPIDNSQLGSAGMWGGSDWGDGLTSINPDDIESINVLKGGTAAALYGSRASNGVIIITTKSGSGREGQGIGVEFNSNITAERYVDTYDFQNQYGHGTRGTKPETVEQAGEYGGSAWGGRLDGSDVYQFDGELRPYIAHEDNYNNFYRTGYTSTNTISLTGGISNQSFRVSFSDLRNEAIVPNSGMNRQTVSLATDGQWADRLTVNGRIQYSREDVQNRARLSDAPGNANYTLSILPPSINVLDLKGQTDKLGAKADGTELQYRTDNNFSQNPWWATYQFENSNIRDRIMGSGKLRYDLMDWLYVQGRIGLDWYTYRRTNLEPYGTGYVALGAMNEIEQRVRETNYEYVVGFDQDLGDFAVNGFFGGSKMERNFETLNARGWDFNIPFLHTIGNGANSSFNHSISKSGINSLFGSAEVSYKDVLFLTGTARNDWFSTLPIESNSILYPSVGASFVFSDAFEMPDFITFGKLRASWAEVGGGTDPYQLALNYSIVGQGHQGAALGSITQGSVPNSQLVPLSLKEYEVGFDLRLFDNKVGIDYAYYHKKTEDDIIQASISQTSGYSSATVNVGEVENSGHEVMVRFSPISTLDFDWDLSVNFAYNSNEVKQLFEDSKILSVQSARSLASAQHRIPYTDADGEFFEGGYSMIVGTAQQRINGQKVYDEEGLPVIDNKTRVLGSGIHPYSGGVKNDFYWKNFNFGFLVDFKFGGDIFTGTNATTYGNGMHKATLEGREDGLEITGLRHTVDDNGEPIFDDNGDPVYEQQTWEIPGSDPNGEGITTVQTYYGRLADIAEYFVQDASFIKLRELTLGYQFPQRLIESMPISGASVSLVARNPWLIYSQTENVDPESTYNTSNGQGLEWFGAPQTKSYGLNLNIKF